MPLLRPTPLRLAGVRWPGSLSLRADSDNRLQQLPHWQAAAARCGRESSKSLSFGPDAAPQLEARRAGSAACPLPRGHEGGGQGARREPSYVVSVVCPRPATGDAWRGRLPGPISLKARVAALASLSNTAVTANLKAGQCQSGVTVAGPQRIT